MEQKQELRVVKDGVKAANETLRQVPTGQASKNPNQKPVGAVANTGYNHK